MFTVSCHDMLTQSENVPQRITFEWLIKFEGL